MSKVVADWATPFLLRPIVCQNNEKPSSFPIVSIGHSRPFPTVHASGHAVYGFHVAPRPNPPGARHLPKSTECRQSFLIVGRGIPDSPTPQCPCPCRSAERRAAGTIVDQILLPPGNRSLPFKRLCFRPIYPFNDRLFQSWRFLRNRS